ncbi:MAG: hypothetical protein LW700_09810 [Gemmataceae bacterium]|jgi:hypothetical protein|nr:hypothetical protein [Gemmataceae bacterium]
MNRRDASLFLGGMALLGSGFSKSRLIAADSPAKLVPGQRTGTANGHQAGHGYTHIPALDVNVSKVDSLAVAMTGAVAAGGNPLECSRAEIVSEVTQILHVHGNNGVKLTLDAHLVGQLWASRDGDGFCSLSNAEVTLMADGGTVLGANFNGRSHSGKDVVFINDHLEPSTAVVAPGEYVLLQRLVIEASHPKRCFHKNVAMAYFGPEGPNPPEWLRLLAAHRDAPKQKDLGFRVILKAENAPVG